MRKPDAAVTSFCLRHIAAWLSPSWRGAFSRFGLWRQILVSILLLLVVQAVATMTSSSAQVGSGNWGMVYAAPVLAIAIGAAELWVSQRPRRVKRAEVPV